MAGPRRSAPEGGRPPRTLRTRPPSGLPPSRRKSVARSAHCACERGRRPASGVAALDSPGLAPLLSRRRSGTVPAPLNLFAFTSHSVPDCACGGSAGLRPAPGAASSGSRSRWPRASSSRMEPRCRKPCRAGVGWWPAHACLRARATWPAPHRPPGAGANALAVSGLRPDSLLRDLPASANRAL